MNRPLIEIWCTKKEAWSRCDTCDGVWWTSIPAGGCDVAGLATGGGDTSAISSPVGQFLYRSSNTSSNFFAMPTTSCVSGLYLNKGGSFWVLLQFRCTQCLVFKWFEWLDIRLIGWPVPIAYLTERAKTLTQNEKIISLIIDEVYTDQRADYSGGVFFGNETGTPTKSLLSFMINSVCGNYEDMVCLIPTVTLGWSSQQEHFQNGKIYDG